MFLWDADVGRKIATIHNKYPIVKDVCGLISCELDTDNPVFTPNILFDYREDFIALPMPMYVCVEDKNASINISMSAIRAYQELRVQIITILSEDKGLLYPLNKFRGQNGSATLEAVNLLEKTCRPDVLEDGTHEALAKAIHDVYSEHFAQEGTRISWDTLEEHKKEQNRDQARSIGKQLHEQGYGITPWIEYGKDTFQFTEKEIEVMAEKEHRRWMGFTAGRKHTHPSLIPWEKLTEGEKDKDRMAVRNFPMYLSKAGFQIYRMKTNKQLTVSNDHC